LVIVGKEDVMSESRDTRKFWVAIAESHIRNKDVDDCLRIEDARSDAKILAVEDNETFYVLEAVERIDPTTITTPLKAVKAAKK